MKKIHASILTFLLFASGLASAAPFLEKTNLFEEGADGFVSYRIPGIIVTAKGSVLAYCEARKYSGADEGEIEIHLRRSTDGGRTWSPAKQIAHLGPRLPSRQDSKKRKHAKSDPDIQDTQTVNNPVAIAGRDGAVHFLYCVEYQRAFYMRSDDDGVTWSKPVEITPVFEQFRGELDWQRIATGPGHAIQLHTSRLVAPFWMTTTNKEAPLKGADGTIYSDDDGKTWKRGDIALKGGNEPNIAELPDGRVFVTARNGDARNRKMVGYSPDGATGWTPPAFVEDLFEPMCMAGLVSHPGTAETKKPLLLFSNPNTTEHGNTNRVNVTVKASEDGGKTWPVSKLLQPGPSAYSDLAVLPDGTVLCFYESGTPESSTKHGRAWAYAELTLAHFNLEWLYDNQSSSNAAPTRAAIPLWPNGAPGALGTSNNDIPTLTPYPPATNATRAAMVICPGGGYSKLMPHEGNDYALWLNQHGVTCFVLKYRLGSSGYHHPAMWNDASRAIRWVRAHAAEYDIDPQRVGIMGSSAGGHLASMMVTHFDAGDTNSTDTVERQSSRPDLGILCYPVISMGEFAHKGSRKALLGTNPPPDLANYLSTELQVKTNTPPCFIWTTWDDKVVPVENTLLFAAALRKSQVPFALHIWPEGPHGMGLNDKPPFANPHPWANECLAWLKDRGFIN